MLDGNCYSQIGAKMAYSTYDLLCASLNQNVEVVKRILDSGVGVNSCAGAGNETALMVAAGGGNLAVVKFLLDYGANINQKSIEGSTAIMPAISQGKTDVVKYLISKGASINYKITSGFRFSPIQLAAQLGYTEIVRELINGGADVNLIAGDGTTPLISAACKGHVEIVQLLLDNNAKKSCRVQGMDASAFAEHFGQTDAKRLLDSYVSKTPSGKGCLLFLIMPMIGAFTCLILLFCP